jgi:outer membrane protein assembly factor BamE
MRKILLWFFCSAIILNLAACEHIFKPYHPPIQQGNILTDDAIKKVKIGMTKDQVSNILGDPVLINPFDNNTWIYIYSLRPSHGVGQKKQVVINFVNKHVSNIRLDLPMPQTPKRHRFF